jgi:hypothetical protein
MRMSKPIMSFTVIPAILLMLAMMPVTHSDSAVTITSDRMAVMAPPIAPCAPGVNQLKNPSFDMVGPNGPTTSWPAQPSLNSAAADWTIHSSNSGAPIKTRLGP